MAAINLGNFPEKMHEMYETDGRKTTCYLISAVL
jgi:hypothetical protein